MSFRIGTLAVSPKEDETGKACKCSSSSVDLKLTVRISGADPFLAGEASYETVIGIQSQGVQAWSVKAYFVA